MSPTRTAVALSLGLLLAATTASAQSEVDAAIARGVSLRREGRDQAALEVFEGVWRSSHAPRALAQVALAEQALGRWVEAEAHLVEALGASGDAWVRDHLGVLQPALADIRRHVGRLDVRGEPAGAEVVIDGQRRGALPLEAALRVPTGSVTFTVRREGYLPVTRTVQVDATYPLREMVSLTPVAPAVAVLASAPREAPAVAPVRRTRTSGVRYAGFALLGVGVAGLAVSGVFLGLNLGAASDAEAATPTSAEPYGAWARFRAANASAGSSDELCALARQQGAGDAAQVRDLCAQVSTSATVALAAGLAGGALAAAGLVMVAVGHPVEVREQARWSVAPWIAQRSGGAVLQGTW